MQKSTFVGEKLLFSAIAENNSYICRMNNNGKNAINIWQDADWPDFRWDDSQVSPLLNSVQERQARLLGMLSALGFDLQKQTNERQRKIINRLYDGFEGPLTSSKWAKICHCSPDTALRDITSLIEKGVLVKAPSGGRNTHYALAIN